MCVLPSVDSDSKDDDNDKEDDEECLKTLKQKVYMRMCLHVYISRYV